MSFYYLVIAVLCQTVTNGPTEPINVYTARLCVCVCVFLCVLKKNAWSLSSHYG